MTEKQIEKVHKLRYKKAFVDEINYDFIRETLYSICEDCSEVRIYCKDDFETLADAIGNDDEAYEFSMQFSVLSNDAYSLMCDIKDECISEHFDDLFVAIKGGDYGSGLFIYDPYEGDYFGLDSLESSLAEKNSQKRLQRLTKSEIIDTATRCFRIFMAFVGLNSRYQDLKAAIDIIRDKHNGFIQIVKKINELYEKADDEYFFGDATREFDRLLSDLPDDVWVQ